MASEPGEHRWVGYLDARPGRFVAICSCGWKSSPMPTAGLAAAASDEHRRDMLEESD